MVPRYATQKDKNDPNDPKAMYHEVFGWISDPDDPRLAPISLLWYSEFAHGEYIANPAVKDSAREIFHQMHQMELECH